MSDNGRSIKIYDIISHVSSPCGLGINIRGACDILHVGANCLRSRPSYGKRDTTTLVHYEHHNYVPLRLIDISNSMYLSTAARAGFSGTGTEKTLQISTSWNGKKRVIDCVHQHTCVHVNFSDISTLLLRNGLWNDGANNYFSFYYFKMQALSSYIRACPDRKSFAIFSHKRI